MTSALTIFTNMPNIWKNNTYLGNSYELIPVKSLCIIIFDNCSVLFGIFGILLILRLHSRHLFNIPWCSEEKQSGKWGQSIKRDDTWTHEHHVNQTTKGWSN